MWLFKGVFSAPQSRHMRQVKQAPSASQHGCWSMSLSPGPQAASLPHRGFGCPHLWELVRQRAEAEICQVHGPALRSRSCSSVCPLREVGGGMRSATSRTLLGKEAEGMAQWGSTWAFLSDVSDVHAMVLSWVCNGEKVPSVYPISWFPKTGISLAKNYIVTNLRLIWHFAGMG